LTQTADKAQIDGAALSLDEFSGKTIAKVALDIDDAPFLAEEEVKPPEEPVSEEKSAEELAAAEAARLAALRRTKRLIGLGLFVVFAFLASISIWHFMYQKVPDYGSAEPSVTVIVVPSPSAVTGPEQIEVTFDDFWVPQRDKTDKVRFLRVHFSTQVTDEKFAREIKDKTLILRDAVYYYLRNKPHEYMIDSANLPLIKQDVADILNGYLTSGKVEDMLFENLLMN